MDLLDDGRIKAIRRRSLEVAKTLLPEPLTAIFYDTTSLYFESDREDGLRLKGYSKDGKPHRVQVVFALLVTPDGLPVGYELFPAVGSIDAGAFAIGAATLAVGSLWPKRLSRLAPGPLVGTSTSTLAQLN